MSSYSFSNQFYQHWTGAPEPVRSAIVQELVDITKLLQKDTPFKEFVFSTHDLDAHLDDLYGAYDKQQALAKELADKQATERLAAEKQRLADEQQAKKKAAEEKAKADADADADADAKIKQKELNEQSIEQFSDSKENLAKLDSEDKQTTADDDDADSHIIKTTVKAVTDHAHVNQAIDLSLKDTELNATHKELLHELEVHIDDYLTEQMLQMSENLKSWLRAEISSQLGEKTQNTESEK